MESIIGKFSEQFRAKYRKGQAEHGGNLWEKPGLIDFAIEEAIDNVAYLFSLKQQLDGKVKVNAFLRDTDEVPSTLGTRNIPNPGSEEAGRLGCMCPIMDNEYGDYKATGGYWYITKDCPVHDKEKSYA